MTVFPLSLSCKTEKYFDMKKVQCKEGLDIYKKFLTRMTRISEFLKVAEASLAVAPEHLGSSFLMNASDCVLYFTGSCVVVVVVVSRPPSLYTTASGNRSRGHSGSLPGKKKAGFRSF